AHLKASRNANEPYQTPAFLHSLGTILAFQNDSSRQETVIAGIEAGAVREAADLVITLSAAEQRRLLDYIVRPYNFRDPLATPEEDDIDPDGVIGHALTALTMISPGEPLPDKIKPYLERHAPLGEVRS
ncbi:hypothetical protein, partial [Sphingobium sp.]|uniref:hypothetical protein n=3 Tax=Alphaproteobacteria TaxID=28211 RepID=UPI00257A3185